MVVRWFGIKLCQNNDYIAMRLLFVYNVKIDFKIKCLIILRDLIIQLQNNIHA